MPESVKEEQATCWTIKSHSVTSITYFPTTSASHQCPSPFPVGFENQEQKAHSRCELILVGSTVRYAIKTITKTPKRKKTRHQDIREYSPSDDDVHQPHGVQIGSPPSGFITHSCISERMINITSYSKQDFLHSSNTNHSNISPVAKSS